MVICMLVIIVSMVKTFKKKIVIWQV
jgi:hypothetical protein